MGGAYLENPLQKCFHSVDLRITLHRFEQQVEKYGLYCVCVCVSVCVYKMNMKNDNIAYDNTILSTICVRSIESKTRI